MPRNIEIKARVADPAALRQRALALATAPEQRLGQDDSFFVLPAGRGRLKLRQFADGSAELIHYQRSDDTAAKGSDYVRVPLAELEPRLPRARFLRVHRNAIVNLDFVVSMKPDEQSQLELLMKDGSTLLANRDASKQLRDLSI